MSSERIKGYTKKPWWIYLVAAGFASVPLATLVQFGLAVGFKPLLLKQVAMSSYFIIETLAALSGAVAVLVVSVPTFVFFVGLSLCTSVVRLNEFLHGDMLGTPPDAALPTFLDAALSTFWLGIGVAFLVTNLRKPYLNPGVRWWQQDDRIRFVSHSAMVHCGVIFPMVTLNLSAGGAFVRLDERAFSDLNEGMEGEVRVDRRKASAAGEVMLSPEEILEAHEQVGVYPYYLGDRVILRLQAIPEAANLAPTPIFESEAEVVWTPAREDSRRFGLGLQFINRTRAERRWLNNYLKLLEKLGFESRNATRARD